MHFQKLQCACSRPDIMCHLCLTFNKNSDLTQQATKPPHPLYFRADLLIPALN